MFKRRKPIHFNRKLREFVYPKMGMRRVLRYYRHRTMRLPGTPESIAAGLACGAAVSFTPLIGLHFLLAMLVAWVLGGNLIAAAIGTIVGNPLTFFFIWLLIYHTGTQMLEMPLDPHKFESFSAVILKSPWELFSNIGDYLTPIVWPMLVGSIPYVVVVWVTTYFVARRLVVRYRVYRLKRQRRERAHDG